MMSDEQTPPAVPADPVRVVKPGISVGIQEARPSSGAPSDPHVAAIYNSFRSSRDKPT
jgi:hypothetical protein